MNRVTNKQYVYVCAHTRARTHTHTHNPWVSSPMSLSQSYEMATRNMAAGMTAEGNTMNSQQKTSSVTSGASGVSLSRLQFPLLEQETAEGYFF